MKIDMHCHVNEGSIDSKVKLEEYITLLKSKGFGGMVVTDHNTYNGYRYWKKHIDGKVHNDFVVIKGVEYDTCDAGHIIVIMPQKVKKRLLEIRGLPVKILIDFVHKNGGVLGPAHPCGEKYMSYARCKSYKKNPKLAAKFDFIETYNACEPEESNDGALKLAQKYHKPGVGGSDAHREACVGMAYTEFEDEIKSELDLIAAIRKKEGITADGQIYDKTTKDKLGKVNKVLVYMFWIYNTGGALLERAKRREKWFDENPMDPIDPIELEYKHKKLKKWNATRMQE